MKFNRILADKVQELEQSTLQSEIDSKLVSIFRDTEFYCGFTTDDTITTTASKPYLHSNRVGGHIKNELFTTENNSRNCCFNHKIGLPKNKYGETNPLFHYQHQLYDTLENHKMVYCLKATGLGITEFMIRWIGWKCLTNNKLSGSDIVIITGPRLELSITIIDRLKKLFIDYIPSFDTKSTTLILNNVTIKAYPSNHLDDARGVPNVSIIYCDESDFFGPKEQENLRDVIERYIAKSDPHIILVSTPNEPDSIMDRIRQEEVSLYERLYFSYKVGVGTMWDAETIEKQKLSPSFEREYNLSFAHNTGNIYNYNDLQQAEEDRYSLAEAEITSPSYTRYMSIDPAFGSSSLGITVVQKKNGKLEVIYADTVERPSISEAIEHIQQLMDRFPNTKKVLIDGSSPGMIKELKLRYKDMFPNYHLMNSDLVDKFIIMSGVTFCPISFQKKRKEMLRHSNYLLSKHYIRIDKRFSKLLTGLRGARTSSNDLDYDKRASPYSDLVDCFLMLSLLITNKE